MSTENKNLYYLHELSDYKVAEDYADVRGWEVYDSYSRIVGKVDGLLVNKHAERVVYLDVEVDESLLSEGVGALVVPANADVKEFYNKAEENHIIIPIGLVQVDEDEKKVFSNYINADTFKTIKRFDKNTDITREYERDVFNTYVPDVQSGDIQTDSTFYKRREFQ